jgi:elongation factor P
VEVTFIYESKGEYWFHEKGKPQNRFMLSKEILGNATQFLKKNTEIKAYKWGEKVIDIELPIKMDFVVSEAPPAVKGNTAQGGTKAVTLETGAKINTPLFIEEGDTIRINTTTGEYVERTDKAK